MVKWFLIAVLAALQMMPEEYVDAARVDGATAWHQSGHRHDLGGMAIGGVTASTGRRSGAAKPGVAACGVAAAAASGFLIRAARSAPGG